MSITGSLIIFVLIWWIIFFSLLPIDVDRKHKEMVEGVDKGSPENPKIIKKIIYTTVITSIIFIGIFMLVKMGMLAFSKIQNQLKSVKISLLMEV